MELSTAWAGLRVAWTSKTYLQQFFFKGAAAEVLDLISEIELDTAKQVLRSLPLASNKDNLLVMAAAHLQSAQTSTYRNWATRSSLYVVLHEQWWDQEVKKYVSICYFLMSTYLQLKELKLAEVEYDKVRLCFDKFDKIKKEFLDEDMRAPVTACLFPCNWGIVDKTGIKIVKPDRVQQRVPAYELLRSHGIS